MPDAVFEELARDVGFTTEDEELLVELGPHIDPHLSSIVDTFYAVICSNSDMRRVFDDDEQIERQKVQLIRWLRRTFLGTYDVSFVEGRSRVGQAHVEVGLEQRYMLSMMSVLRREVVRAVHLETRRLGWDMTKLEAAEVATHRILDLDLALMLEAYRDSYIQKIRLNERLATLGQMAVTIESDKTTARTARAEALAAIGTLTAGLAHEIRNPLNAAKLQLEVLARRAKKLDREVAESILGRVVIVHGEIDRLNKMLNDFLGLARPEEVVSEAVPVEQLFKEIVSLEGPVCAQQQIRLIVTCASGVSVLGDEARLKQVFQNLVSNARQTANVSCIGLGCSRHNSSVVLSVRDNGPGFSGRSDELLEPFVTTKPAGTGLGLPIVKKIVELHGGRLVLSDHEDGGALVEVVLRAGP